MFGVGHNQQHVDLPSWPMYGTMATAGPTDLAQFIREAMWQKSCNVNLQEDVVTFKRPQGPSMRPSSQSAAPEVKVKRKCGRPRNPIPRHKRVSHINAEHRRRGKIQNGFQTLKNMVPKYESSGRDSKADILTKAVEHCKQLKKESKEHEEQLQELRAQKAALDDELMTWQKKLPEGPFFDDQPLTGQQRLARHMEAKSREHPSHYIIGYAKKTLFESFDKAVDRSTKSTFLSTIVDWASQALNQANLRPIFTDGLRNFSKETSFIDRPDLVNTADHKPSAAALATDTAVVLPDSTMSEAEQDSNRKQTNQNRQYLNQRRKQTRDVRVKRASGKTRSRCDSASGAGSSEMTASGTATATVTSASILNPSTSASSQYSHGVSIKTETQVSCSEFRSQCVASAGDLPLKTEMPGSSWAELDPATMPPYEPLLNGMDSPGSLDSALGQSPLGSTCGPDSSSRLGELNDFENSVDQGYETPSFYCGNADQTDFMDIFRTSVFDDASGLDHINFDMIDPGAPCDPLVPNQSVGSAAESTSMFYAHPLQPQQQNFNSFHIDPSLEEVDTNSMDWLLTEGVLGDLVDPNFLSAPSTVLLQ